MPLGPPSIEDIIGDPSEGFEYRDMPGWRTQILTASELAADLYSRLAAQAHSLGVEFYTAKVYQVRRRNVPAGWEYDPNLRGYVFTARGSEVHIGSGDGKQVFYSSGMSHTIEAPDERRGINWRKVLAWVGLGIVALAVVAAVAICVVEAAPVIAAGAVGALGITTAGAGWAARVAGPWLWRGLISGGKWSIGAGRGAWRWFITRPEVTTTAGGASEALHWYHSQPEAGQHLVEEAILRAWEERREMWQMLRERYSRFVNDAQ
jgi:hypothetical protein